MSASGRDDRTSLYVVGLTGGIASGKSTVANMLRGVVGPISDSVRRYLEMLDGDCKRLLGTVNDILDIRKIEGKGDNFREFLYGPRSKHDGLIVSVPPAARCLKVV